MLEEYLLIASGISILLLLAGCTVLFHLRRQSKMNEKILSEQVDALQKCIEKNNEFFNNIAHELKTPLSVIIGAVQLLELNTCLRGAKEKDREPQEPDKAENQEPDITESRLERNIKVIKCNCYRMLRLTHNLLDVTRAQAGYHTLKPVNCDLDLLLEEIVLSVKPYAEEKQLDLQYKASPKKILIAVDMEKIERILLNLLSNAIKFTQPGGSVCVTSYPSRGRAFICVKDSGVGIPPEKQKEIFERFRQAGYSSGIELKGSGIGLSLVRAFVDLHKGNITVESEPGKGTEFIIDLPMRLVSSEVEMPEASELSNGITDAAKLEFSGFSTLAT